MEDPQIASADMLRATPCGFDKEEFRARLSNIGDYDSAWCAAMDALNEIERLEFSDGRISAVVGPEEAGDALWRVATASARLADAITFSRAERPREEEIEDRDARIVEASLRKSQAIARATLQWEEET